MEPTPYVHCVRQRRRLHWRGGFESTLDCVDPHATPDVFWGSQSASNVQGALKESLTTAEECMNSPSLHERQKQNDTEIGPVVSPGQAFVDPQTPQENQHARHLCSSPLHSAFGDELIGAACNHLQLPSATMLGSSPGNTPMPRRARRSIGGVPEAPKKHGTSDAIPFTPFQFVSGVRSILTCPGKHSHRPHQAPAKQHRVKVVRRTLDLQKAPGTALQSRKVAGWRTRRALTASASTGRTGVLQSPDLLQHNTCRTPLETPAPLFSLAEAEATVQPGETQGSRGLPPLATTLRKRSQGEQLHANRKMRAVQTQSQEGHAQQEGGEQSGAHVMVQSHGNLYMGMSPSARMAALRLRD